MSPEAAERPYSAIATRQALALLSVENKGELIVFIPAGGES